jgi:hypothetical protein
MAAAESLLTVYVSPLLPPGTSTSAYSPAALANYTYWVARALRELGHNAEVFVPGKAEASFEHDSVAVHPLKVRTPVYLRVLQREKATLDLLKPHAREGACNQCPPNV